MIDLLVFLYSSVATATAVGFGLFLYLWLSDGPVFSTNWSVVQNDNES